MINTRTEQLLSINQAAAWLGRKTGKRTHLSTIYRWIKGGVEGVRLETVPIGAVMYTSEEALQRFFEAVAAARSQNSGVHPARQAQPSSTARKASPATKARTKAILDDAGI